MYSLKYTPYNDLDLQACAINHIEFSIRRGHSNVMKKVRVMCRKNGKGT